MKKPARKPPPKARVTKSAVGHIELVEGKARLLVTLIGNYIHRIEVERRQMYFNDLDLARVAEVIALGGVEAGMRDVDYREKFRSFSAAMGPEVVRSANASSIASATGYPRETVRRKLKKLVELGFVIELKRAHYVINPGSYQSPAIMASMGRGFHATVLFINEAMSQGLIRWVPPKK